MKNPKTLYEYLFEKYFDSLTDNNCMELYKVLLKDIDLEITNLPKEMKEEIKLILNKQKSNEEVLADLNMTETEFQVAKENSFIVKELKSNDCNIKI